MNLLPAIRKEIMEQWRTSRLLVAVLVMVFFGVTSPLAAKLTPELIRLLPNGDQLVSLIPPPTVIDAVAQYVKNIGQFGIILALLMSMGAIAQEKEKGTAAMMLVKPLPRGTFLLAKFMTLGVSFAVALMLAGLGAYYYTLFLFSAMDLSAWAALNALLWLQIMVYVAVTMLFSTFLRSQAAAAGLGLGVILVLSAIGGIPGIGEYLPGQLANWGAGLMVGKSASYWPALAISMALILASLGTAWVIFEKQEL